jgi:hypothetical protein
MRRLRRIIFNGLTVVSLLLCASTVVLWVRSSKGLIMLLNRPQSWQLTAYERGVHFDNDPLVEDGQRQADLQSRAWWTAASHGTDSVNMGDPSIPPQPVWTPPNRVRLEFDYQILVGVELALPVLWIALWSTGRRIKTLRIPLLRLRPRSHYRPLP